MPKTLKTSSSQEEGYERFWKYQTKEFVGENGYLTGVKVVDLDWTKPADGSRGTFTEKPNSDKITGGTLKK